MMWIDNYNKFRYSRNPNEDRSMCINATVSALLPLPTVEKSMWTGWPDAGTMFAAAHRWGKTMVAHHKEFSDRFRNLFRENVVYEQVRVPLDYRRYQVRSVPWYPFELNPADINGTEGLQTGRWKHLRRCLLTRSPRYIV